MIRENARDHARTPYQWSDAANAGFSVKTPWIQVNPNYVKINRKSQEADPDALLNFYRQLIELRQMNPVLLSGDFVPLKATRSLMAYERQNSEKTWVVVLNFSEKERKNPYSGRCILSNYNTYGQHSTLRPYEGILIEKQKKI
jgi:glycosidase